MTETSQTRDHRFDLYTRYEHLPEHLQGYSRPFCNLARWLWERGQRGKRPTDIEIERAWGVLFIDTPWLDAVDHAECDVATDYLRRARAHAANPLTWMSPANAAQCVRAVIQAKDAFVRACLPEPEENTP